MRKIVYALASYDHKMGTVDYYIKMPMDGVETGESLPRFLESAGEYGWQLCGVIPNAARKGTIMGLPPEYAKATGKSTRTIEDPAEITELIFSKSF